MILKVDSLAKHFTIHHLNRSVPAFFDVSFQLHPGEFILVSGPNGVGKSTLLRCLYRTYLSSGGSALYRSRYGEIDLTHAAEVDIMRLRAEEIGHVTQFLHPRPRVSALGLVMEPMLATGATQAAATEQTEHLLATFGLKPELWQAYPTTFSGGEQQKVNLARSLAHNHRLLLLDEPTASLDARARAALVTQLADLKNAGVAMLGVFHHPEDVRHLIDRTLTLAAPSDAREEEAYVAQ